MDVSYFIKINWVFTEKNQSVMLMINMLQQCLFIKLNPIIKFNMISLLEQEKGQLQ